MKTIDKIKATIRNLRARAGDAGSSEAEALAAITKAEALMRDFDLTVEDLEASANTGGIVKAVWTRGTLKSHPAVYTASAIALLTETKVWELTNDQYIKSTVFMGFEADTEYALYLCDLIYTTMEAGWSDYRETPDYASVPRNKRGRLREDFMRGVATRVRGRITAMAAERRTHAPDIKATVGTDLVVAKRALISTALEAEGLEFTKKRKVKVRVDARAYNAGRAAGDRAIITTGIGCTA